MRNEFIDDEAGFDDEKEEEDDVDDEGIHCYIGSLNITIWFARILH